MLTMGAILSSFICLFLDLGQQKAAHLRSIPEELWISHISDALSVLDLISLLHVDRQTFDILIYRAIERHGLSSSPQIPYCMFHE